MTDDTFDSRRTEFLQAFGKLRDEYRCDFVSVPTYAPSDDGSWKLYIQPQIFDLDKMVTPSPIIV